MTAVTGVAVTGYMVLLGPAHMQGSGAAIAAAAVSGSRAMEVLEQQRQQIIVMDAASRTMSVVGQPKVAARPTALAGTAGGSGTTTDGTSVANLPAPDPGTAESIAYNMLSSFGWAPGTFYSCLNNIWSRESGWRYNAENASGAYGIPQAVPGSKMASAGRDWQNRAKTQIRWGLDYIRERYNSPRRAWLHEVADGWY